MIAQTPLDQTLKKAIDTPVADHWDKLYAWALAHVTNGIRIVFILILCWLVVRLARGIIRRVERIADDNDPTTVSEQEKRARTLGKILRQTVTVGLWALALVLVLAELGLDIKPLLAGAGIVGLAIGFGAQTLVKDLISGFFLLLENQVRVGDVVTIGELTGLVEAITLRTSVLRDVNGIVHTIPNGSVAVVSNHTREWSRALLDIGVSYQADLEAVLQVMKEVGQGLEQDPVFGPKLLEPFEYPGVERFGESEVVLRMMVKTRPLEQWAIQRELRLRIKTTFDRRGIQIPFPQRTLHVEGLERLAAFRAGGRDGGPCH